MAAAALLPARRAGHAGLATRRGLDL